MSTASTMLVVSIIITTLCLVFLIVAIIILHRRPRQITTQAPEDVPLQQLTTNVDPAPASIPEPPPAIQRTPRHPLLVEPVEPVPFEYGIRRQLEQAAERQRLAIHGIQFPYPPPRYEHSQV
jgi:hypothetical protein